MTEPDKNKLYFGDNLEVMREYLADESVDLVYLDPPFNSNVSYNVLFEEHNGTGAASQIQAFDDTWRWDQNAMWAYESTVEAGGQLAETLIAFRKIVGTSDMLAYLSMMAPRLAELRRVLKPTGSIYLHCDDMASHYLKLLMDAVFGAPNYRNEIIWQRSNAHNTAHKFGRVHDVILFYTCTDNYIWTCCTTPYSEKQTKRYRKDSDGRLYTGQDLTAARPNSESGKFEWRGTMPPASRGWGYTRDQLEKWWQEGRILTRKDGSPRMDGLKVYLDEMKGKPLQSVWTDIPRIANTAAERLGYPTQKPVSLLERIIMASSREGDTVLDPFCGCGTTIDAAEKLNRRWIGIDITHLAVGLIRHRLKDTYGDGIEASYEVYGEPTSVPDARVLAEQDPFQFQWWLLGLVGARPIEKKKGADKGIDGRLYFHEGDGETRQIILSVKAGKPTVSHLRDLRGVIDREEAAIGVLLLMHSATKPMREEAASAGVYESSWGRFPRLQILTVAEILQGKDIERPRTVGMDRTFKKAKKYDQGGSDQMTLREAAADYGTEE